MCFAFELPQEIRSLGTKIQFFLVISEQKR